MQAQETWSTADHRRGTKDKTGKVNWDHIVTQGDPLILFNTKGKEAL